MKHYKVFLAFGLGCLAAVSLHLVSRASAQQRQGGAPNSLESRLRTLEQRLKELEKYSVTQPSKKVVAPFEVTDHDGHAIFTVNNDGATVSNGDTNWVKMGGDKDGGRIVANSFEGYSWWLDTAFGMPGFSVVQGNSPRIKLGKNVDLKDYRLAFISGNNQNIAGIGEDPETHNGLVLIYDKSGNLKDRMAIAGGKGLVDVLGLNPRPIVQLTEGGDKGGYLLICSVNGCDPPMVEAGDAGGYGIVRAGPHMFQRGVTMLDLPGSVIMGRGKSQ